MAHDQFFWKSLVKTFLCASFCIHVAQNAEAGWRDTEWGMNDEQFRKAAPFLIDAFSPDGSPVLFYDEDDRRMWVNPRFEDGELISVYVAPYDSEDCDWFESKVKDAFRGYPNRPISQINLGRVFFDSLSGNEVDYWEGTLCSLTFRPLRGDGQP